MKLVFRLSSAALLALLLCQLTGVAQTLTGEQIFSLPKVRRALDYLKATEAETINEQIKTCEIPAPTFKEEQRAAYLKQRFSELGLKKVRIDRIGNVIGERPGT